MALAPDKVRIAMLGGGLGSLSAAYWLTQGRSDQRELRDHRLSAGLAPGREGASGRSLRPDCGSRIEEHGLHLAAGPFVGHTG